MELDEFDDISEIVEDELTPAGEEGQAYKKTPQEKQKEKEDFDRELERLRELETETNDPNQVTAVSTNGQTFSGKLISFTNETIIIENETETRRLNRLPKDSGKETTWRLQ